MPQGTSKTMPMQMFRAVEAVYYGIVQVENSKILGNFLNKRGYLINNTLH